MRAHALTFLLISLFFWGCSKSNPTDPFKVDKIEKDPRGPRWSSLARSQTEEEEANAKNWKPPQGDTPVFTTDWVSKNETVWNKYLAHLKNKPEARGLEIGSFEGRSAIWFLKNILTHPTAKLTCVDVFGERLDLFFDHNIKVSGVGSRVIKVSGKSQEELRRFPPKPIFDFVYIDGLHLAPATLVDAVMSWDLVKDGGLVIFDDYMRDSESSNPLNRTKSGVDAFLMAFGPLVEIVYRDYQLIFRKNSAAY